MACKHLVTRSFELSRRVSDVSEVCTRHCAPNTPDIPPTLGEAMHKVAKLGGFLGRKCDGRPGATALWRGLARLSDITETFSIFHPPIPARP
ncbi:IS4 family transposase [Thiocapsa rosea]|uniref:IS4 family transposase n=1 Tax=Thiocapsa rosea TaxID=69360 RepID=UPI000EB10AE2